MNLMELRKNRFINNTGWMVSERIIQMLISLVVGTLTARYLGPTNYGVLNYSLSFITLFIPVCALGIESIVIKELIDQPEKEGEILGSGILARVISGVFSTILVNITIFILNRNDRTVLLISALQSLSLIFRAFTLIDFWFQRKLESKYVVIIKTIAYILVSAYKVILLINKSSIYLFAVSNSIDVFLISLMLVFFYKKRGGSKISATFAMSRQLLSQSYHYIISGLMVALYGQMDKIMIGYMIDQKFVGLYSSALVICDLWVFIPLAVINSARPIIIEAKKKDEQQYLKRLKQLYTVIIWMSIIFSIGVFLLAKPIIYILYGKQYLDAAPVLRVAIWFEVFSMIGTARGIWILCENKNKFVKYYLLYGLITNFILNIILIPIYGMIGAAIATLFTQIVTSMIAPLFYKETRIHTKYVIEAFFLINTK